MKPRFPVTGVCDAGFTLVELMVALVLGLILTGGVINIYISSKQTYRTQDNESRIQENGRFALQYLTKDIRMVGYMGCNNYNAVTPNVVANPPVPSFDAKTVIQGYDYVSGSLPSGFPSAPTYLVPNNSVLLVNYSRPSGVFITSPPPNGQLTAQLNVNVTAVSSSWVAGDILFVTDCAHADVFRATTISNGASSGNYNIAHGGDVNTDNKLSWAYDTGAQVMAFGSYMYFIGSMAGGTSTSCPCGLYREPSPDGKPLVDNVQSMQITYGVDLNNDKTADTYLSAANTAGKWDKVVSTRITLLLTSQDNNLVDTPQNYTFNGTPTTASDRRLYTTFSDTVTLRNRAP